MFASLLNFYPSVSEKEWLSMPAQRMFMYYDYMLYLKRYEPPYNKDGIELNKNLNKLDKRSFPHPLDNYNNNNNLLNQLSGRVTINKNG